MENKNWKRRKFIGTTALASVGAILAGSSTPALSQQKKTSGTLAVLGGTPVRPKTKVWPQWPIVDNNLLETLLQILLV